MLHMFSHLLTMALVAFLVYDQIKSRKQNTLYILARKINDQKLYKRINALEKIVDMLEGQIYNLRKEDADGTLDNGETEDEIEH